CANSPVTITNNSTSNWGTIASYDWDMGNGSTSASQNPTYTYSGSGSYGVQLVVTSSLGCIDTARNTVQIYDLPVADFSTVTGCQNSTIPFTNLTTLASGSILSYAWNF